MNKNLLKRISSVCTSAVVTAGSLLAVSGGSAINVSAAGSDDYAKLLQYSLYFYDANMCGDQVQAHSALSWRGNCHTSDAVVGGYHDAGDHVMFGLPQGYAASTIAWSYYEYKEVYNKLGLGNHFKTISKHFTDYFKKSTEMSGGNVSRFLYQKGEGGPDHAYWGAPEQQGDRGKMYWVNSGASDIAAEYAAALALDYINFGDTESLDYAKALYKFSCQSNQVATDGTGGFYESESCQDDQAWAAAWLYMATKDDSYLNDAKSKNTQYLGWAHAWGNVDLGAACVIAEATNDWAKVNGYLGSTCQGSNYLCMDGWGSARYNCCMQFVSLVASKHSSADYSNWAKGQMDIILGANGGQNYVVGWNDKSPTHCHHRAASGLSDANTGEPNKYELVGALVGGPNKSGYYQDKRDEYETNEVAVDYQAGLVGAAAALYDKFGTGSTVTSIPGVDKVDIGNPQQDQPKETDPPKQETQPPQQTEPKQETQPPQQTQPKQETQPPKSDSSSNGAYELKVGKSYNYNTMDDKMIGFKYEDFGLKPGDPKLTKVEVDISANGAIKTWQGAFGSSTTVEADEYWTMTEQMEQSISGNSGTLTWEVPSKTADIIQYGYNGEIKVGFWWIDNPEFTIDAVRLYTAGGSSKSDDKVQTQAPVTTSRPASTTTTTVTTQTEARNTEAPKEDKVQVTKWGDANMSGNVDVSDAVLIARFAAEDPYANISSTGIANADVDHNGEVTIDDCTKILRYIAKMIREDALAQ